MEFKSGDIVTHSSYPKNSFFQVIGTSSDICHCVYYPSNHTIKESTLLNFSKDLVNLVTYSPTLEILILFKDYV